MSAAQAESVAEAFGSATAEQIATKSDLNLLRADLNVVKTELRAEILGIKSEVALLRWMIGFALALLVAVFGKLFLH